MVAAAVVVVVVVVHCESGYHCRFDVLMIFVVVVVVESEDCRKRRRWQKRRQLSSRPLTPCQMRIFGGVRENAPQSDTAVGAADAAAPTSTRVMVMMMMAMTTKTSTAGDGVEAPAEAPMGKEEAPPSSGRSGAWRWPSTKRWRRRRV